MFNANTTFNPENTTYELINATKVKMQANIVVNVNVVKNNFPPPKRKMFYIFTGYWS